MNKAMVVILDGFGLKSTLEGNAPRQANMPILKNLWENYPHSFLEASEEAVGLKKGQPGNSEVGHMTIGAGRLLKQNEILVDEFLEQPDMDNPNIKNLVSQHSKDVHIMGLASDGNIHAGIDDFIKMYKFLICNGFTKIHFHLITDGRDTGIHDSIKYIDQIRSLIEKNGIGDIVSICGRYYAMDRDKNWDRTKLYYNLVVNGVGKTGKIEDLLKEEYEAINSDEFVRPIILNEHTIKEEDVLIWMNYREDRAKQILRTFTDKKFKEFKTKDLNLSIYSFLNVDESIPTINMIEKKEVINPLGLYLSKLGITQARIAESEKYAHVTYFFDCGFEKEIPLCDKIHVPSLSVPTYDLKPEMSAQAVTVKVLEEMKKGKDFILVNYANPDMVGHTGVLEAAIKACETVDRSIGEIIDSPFAKDYGIFILADHGNVDTMINEDKSPCTTHTTALVPFILCDKKYTLKNGTLVNVAGTVLDYMELLLPQEMIESKSLLSKK